MRRWESWLEGRKSRDGDWQPLKRWGPFEGDTARTINPSIEEAERYRVEGFIEYRGGARFLTP